MQRYAHKVMYVNKFEQFRKTVNIPKNYPINSDMLCVGITSSAFGTEEGRQPKLFEEQGSAIACSAVVLPYRLWQRAWATARSLATAVCALRESAEVHSSATNLGTQKGT